MVVPVDRIWDKMVTLAVVQAATADPTVAALSSVDVLLARTMVMVRVTQMAVLTVKMAASDRTTPTVVVTPAVSQARVAMATATVLDRADKTATTMAAATDIKYGKLTSRYQLASI